MGGFLLLGAFVIDLAVGDPAFIPHPVVLMGKLIERGERLLRRFVVGAGLKAAGCLLVVFVVAAAFAGTWLALYLAYLLNFWLGTAVNLWLLSTTIAAKGLAGAAAAVYRYLKAGNLAEARRAVGMIVGRDTDRLSEPEVVRAAVETVAENLVDGVVSPLFYAMLGGAPLAMAYKAVNTLDSMVGYKNERYREFGRCAARLDDALNYLPARLLIPFMTAAVLVLRLDLTRAIAMLRRDAGLHPSPNGGIPEAFMAGALGVQLGGENYYFGRPGFRATMGDKLRTLIAEDILVVNRVMYLSSATFAAVAGALLILGVL